MSAITPPKAQIPVGLVVISDREYEVRQHPEFVRFFFDLFRRVGGTNGTSSDELLDLAFFDPPRDPQVADAVRGLEEMRIQLDGLRSDYDNLRRLVGEQEAELQTLRGADQLRNRVEQLEDRLA
jgi:hypothetical protein